MIEAQTRPTTFAAASPAGHEDDSAPALTGQDRDLHVLCERWVAWGVSRRLYGPKPLTGTILGRLSGCGMRPMAPDGPDAISSAELSAFHIAYTCQPNALDKQAFDLYYLRRAKPVKTAAAALGITREHFHRLINAFRVRVANAADAIAADNQQQLQAMTARRAARALDGVAMGS